MVGLRRVLFGLWLMSPSVSAAAEFARLSYVNGRPQFNITDDFFALYIGLWRGFDAPEYDVIHRGAVLLSRRHVDWQVMSCEVGHREVANSDLIWTLDALNLASDGRVEPLREAWRPGYRYFSLLNLHGLYLRGTGEFKRPKRESGEEADAYRDRLEAARKAWWEAASPRGKRGIVDIALEMRLVPWAGGSSLEDQFIKIEDYGRLAQSSAVMQEIFHRTAPSRWPVSYDERAHKPHQFWEPLLWRESPPLMVRSDGIRARLEWDWCAGGDELKARILVPRGQSIAPGPNREGRDDHGPASIEVVEGDW